MVDTILESVVDRSPGVRWDDIEGLKAVKLALIENIVYPQLNPSLFSGIRSPDAGVLLYGPPGNGKTMLAKAVATECKCTFFSMSASSLVSKWMGESEKLMKTLFALARLKAPSVIFFDEIDSILTKRSGSEHEAGRRLKTEFLVQVDGCNGASKAQPGASVLVIGATNRPFDLDEAALRRLTKRIYIELPDGDARIGCILRMLSEVDYKLSRTDQNRLRDQTSHYSFADLNALVKDAAMGPIRDIQGNQSKIMSMDKSQLRKVCYNDFQTALSRLKPSVSAATIAEFREWERQNKS